MDRKLEFEEYEEKYQNLSSEEQEKIAIKLVKEKLQERNEMNSSEFDKMVDIHLIQNNADNDFYEIISLQRMSIVEHYSYTEFLIRKKH